MPFPFVSPRGPAAARFTRLMAAGLGVLVMTFAQGPAWGRCPTDRARYVLTKDTRYTAGFIHVNRYIGFTKLLLFVRSDVTNNTYWFFFDGGSAHYIFLYSIPLQRDRDRPPVDFDSEKGRDGPLDASTIQFLRRGYVFEYVPDPQSFRPEYILLSDLPALLATQGQPRERPPLAFFKFDHCAAVGATD